MKENQIQVLYIVLNKLQVNTFSITHRRLWFLLCPDGGASDSERGRLCVQHVSVHPAALPRLHAGSNVQRRTPHCQGRTWKLLHRPRRTTVSVSVKSNVFILPSITKNFEWGKNGKNHMTIN